MNTNAQNTEINNSKDLAVGDNKKKAFEKLPKTTKTAIENKVKEHNEKHGSAKTKRTTKGTLAVVWWRGRGAYFNNPESVRPHVKSAEQWAMARVNSFLYVLRNGRFRSGKHDTDMLPAGHPQKGAQKAIALRKTQLPRAAKDEPWGWDTEVANEVLGDPPNWVRYKRAHLYYSPNNEDTKAGYKLPIAKMIDGELTLIFRGAAAAMGAVNGARGGVDIPEADRVKAYEELTKIYEEFDMEPPRLRTREEIRALNTINTDVFVEPDVGTGQELDTDFDADYVLDEDSTEEHEVRSDHITNFPKRGDNKKVSLRNSNWPRFPIDFAEKIKNEYPELWKKGGNIRGNQQYRLLKPLAEKGGVPTTDEQEKAVRLREAWVARHLKDFRVAGTVAQIKWLAIGSRGLPYMKNLMREEMKKIDERHRDINDKSVLMRVSVISGKFYIDAEEAPELNFMRGCTYVFDLDQTAAAHPLRFSTTRDGTHGGGEEYDRGVEERPNRLVFRVPIDAPDTMHYYCTNHAGMGNSISLEDERTNMEVQQVEERNHRTEYVVRCKEDTSMYFEFSQGQKDKFRLEGVASSTSIDTYGTEMSKEALENMAEQMRAGIPILPKHNSFSEGGMAEWDDVIGRTYDAEIIEQSVNNSATDDEKNYILLLRSKLYKEEEKAVELARRIERGEPIGQSIGGWFDQVRVIENSQGDIERVIVDQVVLDHVAITRAPANPDSNGLSLRSIKTTLQNFKRSNAMLDHVEKNAHKEEEEEKSYHMKDEEKAKHMEEEEEKSAHMKEEEEKMAHGKEEEEEKAMDDLAEMKRLYEMMKKELEATKEEMASMKLQYSVSQEYTEEKELSQNINLATERGTQIEETNTKESEMNADDLRSLIERTVSEALAAKEEVTIKEQEVSEVDALRAKLAKAERSLEAALSKPLRFGRAVTPQPMQQVSKLAEESRAAGHIAIPTFLERASERLESIDTLSQSELQDLLTNGLRAFEVDGLLS